MVFCNIDDELLTVLDDYLTKSGQRCFVDCGAGEGEFERKMKETHGTNVLSLDFRADIGSHVQNFDCREFPFVNGMIPIFIRPCHGSFVEDTVRHAFNRSIEHAIYVSMPHNLDVDLFGFPVKRISNWEGADGERIYEVQVPPTRLPIYTRDKLLYTAIKYYETRFSKRETSWGFVVGEYLVNTNGSGYKPSFDNIVIIDTTRSDNLTELDWHETYLDQPDANAGWLDRSGKFFGCNPCDHDLVALFLLKKQVHELEDIGWVRVYGAPAITDNIYWTHPASYASEPSMFGRLTAEQRNWLLKRGHRVYDSD